jgi:PAS domain S-box-containing protein
VQEARAPESDEELRLFLADAAIGLRWVDPDGRILWANRADLALAGCREHEYIGHHVAEFLVEPHVPAEILSLLARGKPVAAYRARLRAADGVVKEVLIDGSALFRDGTLVHSRWFTRDITALLEKEEAARHRAEETSHVQDDFLALLSHELRAPLGTVLIWLGLLRQGGSDPDETDRALEIMDRSAKTLEHIIEDLLHASRIAAGGLTLNPELVDLRTVVQNAVEAAFREAEAKGLRLDWSHGANPVEVLADPGRLQQAVANLLSNAVKFTPSGGRIDVRLDTANQQARLRVCDTGEGMSPGFLPFAFRRFSQQDSTSTRHHHGLGLGLYVVRHVIEHHGGAVQAESAGPGRGSTFTIVLPVAAAGTGRADAGPWTVAAPVETFALRAGLRILVVDDENDVREALTRLLQQNGAVVTGAASAEEAFAAVESLRPDVILSDIAMPVEDGLSFIRRVRRLPLAEGGQIPAAALSAYAGTEHRQQALSAGFQDHVRKPIEPSHLLRVIARLTGLAPSAGAERSH